MFKVNKEKCVGCKLCVKDCFVNDIEMIENKAYIRNETCFKCGHCIAICPQNAVSTDDYNMDEVVEYNKENFDIDSDNLLNFIKFRRTIRYFKDKDIEVDKIKKIIDAGRFTPTGGNLQNVSYIVIRDDIDKLKAMAIETLNSMGEYVLNNLNLDNIDIKGYAKKWIRMHNEYKENPKNDSLFFNAPMVLIVASESDVNASLASSNMELMANTLGLGCLYSGFFVRATKENDDIKKFLNIDENKNIITCMVIGYPSVKYQRVVPRKDADITWR